MTMPEHHGRRATDADWSRLTVIMVTHHSAAVIGTCADQFRNATDVIVVDNASDDETLDIVRSKLPQARILQNRIGVGYSGAANLAQRHSDREFVLYVNPDSVVGDQAVAALLDKADQYPEAAVICPQNYDGSGDLALVHDVPMFDQRIFPKALRRRDREPAPEGDLCAAFISGAVNLVRVVALREVGGFDENIFLYFEDDDLCMRFRQAGYPLILTQDAAVTHLNAGSVRPSLHYHWEKFWCYGWSRLYIENKHHGVSSALALGIRNLARFGFKALGYVILLRFRKAFRDAARFTGTISYLVGIPAVSRRTRRINEAFRERLAEQERDQA